MTHVVTRSCCNDASCVGVCPVNCIHPTPDEPGYLSAEMLYIDPDTCIDCGACIDACPVDAIVPDYELPEDAAHFTELNARYYAVPEHRDYSTDPVEPRRPVVSGAPPGPLRVAIVGSGPAAAYAAEELVSARGVDVEVHVFERLPTPWGLVRYGVAPDHQDTKSVTDVFARLAGRGVRFHLNVDIGRDLTHEDLLTHHHAVLYAVGARRDRRLGVPGEDLPGSHPATDIVAWYNGYPGFADLQVDLSGDRAVVVGNGNVALDVARILAADVDYLARTDIADHALEALSASKISEVVVLGRRGPAQAAYTVPELYSLANTPGIEVAALDGPVRELADKPLSGKGKRVLLRFYAAPVEVLGQYRVRGLRVERTELVPDGLRLTGRTEDLDCELLVRSIGYRGEPIPGLPFDERTGVMTNVDGRVAPGVYTAGWAKRGPSGVIGTNRKCASDTVRVLLEDFARGKLGAPSAGVRELDELLARRRPGALEYQDWKAIDRHERTQARPRGRPRVKIVDVQEMLDVAKRSREM